MQLLEWAVEAHPRHLSDNPADIRISLSYLPQEKYPWVPRNAIRRGHVDELCFWSGRGQLNALTGIGSATLAPMDNDDYERLRMKGLTRIFVARYLLSRGGVAMHAAGALRNEQAHLFIGPSGAGKTTIVTQWPNDAIFGDDQIILTESNSGFTIHDTPYPGNEGTLCAKGSAPLSHIYVLEQSENTALEPLGKAAAFRALSKQVFHIGSAQNDASLIFELLERLTNQVPISLLKFSLRTNPWDALHPPSTTEVTAHV